MKDAILEKFLWDLDDSFFDKFESIKAPPSFSAVVQAFRENLDAAFTVGSVPSIMARGAVLQQRFNQLLTAARIRSLKTGKDAVPPESRDRVAFEIAQRQFDEDLTNIKIRNELTDQAIIFVETILINDTFPRASEELLRQVLVMIWGAFEVVATDLCLALLNAVPELTALLDRSKRFKNFFSMEVLKEYNFDLSKNMGTAFFEHQRLDSIPLIQEVYSLIIDSNADVTTALKSNLLWNLSQKRHLIVHRRSIVDRQYLRRTGDSTAEEGGLLRVRSSEIISYIKEVRDTGLLLSEHVINALPMPITGESDAST